MACIGSPVQMSPTSVATWFDGVAAMRTRAPSGSAASAHCRHGPGGDFSKASAAVGVSSCSARQRASRSAARYAAISRLCSSGEFTNAVLTLWIDARKFATYPFASQKRWYATLCRN